MITVPNFRYVTQVFIILLLIWAYRASRTSSPTTGRLRPTLASLRIVQDKAQGRVGAARFRTRAFPRR